MTAVGLPVERRVCRVLIEWRSVSITGTNWARTEESESLRISRVADPSGSTTRLGALPAQPLDQRTVLGQPDQGIDLEQAQQQVGQGELGAGALVAVADIDHRQPGGMGHGAPSVPLRQVVAADESTLASGRGPLPPAAGGWHDAEQAVGAEQQRCCVGEERPAQGGQVATGDPPVHVADRDDGPAQAGDVGVAPAPRCHRLQVGRAQLRPGPVRDDDRGLARSRLEITPAKHPPALHDVVEQGYRARGAGARSRVIGELRPNLKRPIG